MPSSSIAILGAGLCGLSCALHLRRPYQLLEASDEVGGVARSHHMDGFVFDVTGHWLHLRDEATRTWVDTHLSKQLQTIKRRAAVYSHGRFTPYPFQAHTYGLPSAVIADCVLGFFAARERSVQGAASEPKNFEDFIRQRMGDGIAEHFMLPYNTKLWTVPPAELSYAWCQRFVPLPTPEEVVLGALDPEGAGHALGYNTEFLYPKEGGIDLLARTMATQLEIPAQLGMAAQQVDWQGRRVITHAAEVPYEALVSTIPLPELVRRLSPCPPEIAQAAGELRATSLTYWNIGLRRSNRVDEPHWTYFPDDAVPFYRVGSPSAVTPHVAPQAHRSYSVEVAHPGETPCPVDDAQVLTGLRQVGFIGHDEQPILMSSHTLYPAYVIMDSAYGQARDTILNWLNQQHIYSIGRYGAWMYDSMEGAIIQGRETARRLNAEL